MSYNDRELCLREEITYLIMLQQEGKFWDFKKEWYSDKADMLHDIICMANNLCNRTAYIIIGIDEEDGFHALDVRLDKNRRNTQKIVDFLKDKKFAGGVRPVVHVESLLYQGVEIDVIVIENSYDTPFFLVEKYAGVCANNIYTRIQDTNTPKTGSADINHIEQLWRKRFHLDEAPLDKFYYYLKNADDWQAVPNQDESDYYRYSPEYTITVEADKNRTGYEYYMFGQINQKADWYNITLQYNQTAIAEFQGCGLDGGVCFVVAPDRAFGLSDIGISSFGFYIQDGLNYRLLEYYHKKCVHEEYSFMTYMQMVVVFQSSAEYECFLSYLRNHKMEYDEMYNQIGDQGIPHIPIRKLFDVETTRKECRDAFIINQMLREFRYKNNISEMEKSSITL